MKTSALRRFGPPLVLVLLYWGLALAYLAVMPRVYQDEPWQASTGLKLARQGIFGSDLFEGFGGMENRYYGFLPVYPAALAVVYLVADVGLFQTRWLGVVCGALTLSLTFSLGQRIWRDPRIGTLAVLLLLAVRWFGETKIHPTGILFFDATRLARYDVLVPVFALFSVHTFLSARSSTKRVWYPLTGLLVGLAGLTHLYGLFLVPVFALLILWQRERGWLTQLFLLLLGVVIVWLPYLGYVLADLPTWRMQTQLYAPRFDLLNPNWYIENLRAEHARYALGPGPLRSYVLRPGAWFSFAAVGLAWFAVVLGAQINPRARVVFVTLTLLPLCFALLLQNKFINYLLLVAPFAALAASWGIVRAWDTLKRSRVSVLRAGIVLALVLVIVESSIRLAAFQIQAAITTPYAALAERLRANIPVGSRVLGLQDYWFGWDEYEYRSIAVPWMLVVSELDDAPSVDAAMNAQAPDYVLLDDASRLFLTEHAETFGRDFNAWMKQHNAMAVTDFTDPGYGRFIIYQIQSQP